MNHHSGLEPSLIISSALGWRDWPVLTLVSYSPWGCQVSDMTEWLSARTQLEAAEFLQVSPNVDIAKNWPEDSLLKFSYNMVL